MARRFAYMIATLFIVAFGVLAGAPAAWAHAKLKATSLADGSIVQHAPTRVTATFDEAVGAWTFSIGAPSKTSVNPNTLRGCSTIRRWFEASGQPP